MAEKMRVFHITKRAEDGKWTVKEEKTDDVLHTFDTRVEATQYCEQFAEEKDALLKYHASKGKNKGRIIEVYNSRTMDPKEFAKLMEKYEAENDALTDDDEGPDAVEDEVEEPSFYTDCSNPLVLSSVNLGVKEDLTFRNTKSAVTFDGNLLLDANILLSKIVYQINFDLHIVNNLDEEYICYVSIPIKLSDENNLKTIYDGSYTMSYTKLESNRFYKLEK